MASAHLLSRPRPPSRLSEQCGLRPPRTPQQALATAGPAGSCPSESKGALWPSAQTLCRKGRCAVHRIWSEGDSGLSLRPPQDHVWAYFWDLPGTGAHGSSSATESGQQGAVAAVLSQRRLLGTQHLQGPEVRVLRQPAAPSSPRALSRRWRGRAYSPALGLPLGMGQEPVGIPPALGSPTSLCAAAPRHGDRVGGRQGGAGGGVAVECSGLQGQGLP